MRTHALDMYTDDWAHSCSVQSTEDSARTKLNLFSTTPGENDIFAALIIEPIKTIAMGMEELRKL